MVLAGDDAADKPALQRVAFGARRVVSAAPPDRAVPDQTFVAPPGPISPAGPVLPRDEGGRPAILALPRADGAPHPQSAIELTMWRLVQADEELRPLLLFNRTMPEVAPLEARADMLWRDGRVAVEIDGPEHRRPANYRQDRHRDYKLVCAGYCVLRVTNDEVAETRP